MNKPSKSRIEHRAIEIVLTKGNTRCLNCRYFHRDNSYCTQTEKSCVVALMESALEQAEKELTKVILTPNQKKVLKEKLEALENTTGHKYDYLTYTITPGYKKKISLDWSVFGDSGSDCIYGGSFITFADLVFTQDVKYNIKELLND